MLADLRFAFRTLGRSPALVLLAVFSLALGIGANTAIFSLLYQVVLRSVPVRDPQSLVLLHSDDYSFGWTRKDNNGSVYSYPMYRELRDRNQAFSGLIARSSFTGMLASHGDAASAKAEVVTGNFFDVLGVRPALGRLLLPNDDAPGRSPVIVLSYAYWAGHLGHDPNVLNSQMLMNGHPVMVAGVAAESFRGVMSGQTPDFFAPVSMMSLISPGWQRNDVPDAYWLSIIGRLRPGMTEQRADAMLLPLFRGILAQELPSFKDVEPGARKRILEKTLSVQPAAQGLNTLRDQWQKPLLVLMAMVGLVLLIACANVANLLIARATARRREIAVRLAVGASNWQVARQLVVESLVLAFAGGALGLLLSDALTRGLLSLLPADATGGWLAPELDFRLLGFSMLLALVTGVLFGLVPALQARKADVAPALKEQTGGMSAPGSQSRIRQALVVAQICLSLLLLIGAGLFTRSLVNLAHNNPGFRAGNLVTFQIDPSLSGYTQARSLALFRDIENSLQRIPGVTGVTHAEFPQFGGYGWGSGVKAPGSLTAADKYADCGQNSVGAGYFRTFGIPLLAGREFNPGDTLNSPKVAVINETFARYLYGPQNPIGRHMTMGPDDADVQIVGVVKDSKYGSLREKSDNFLYVPYDQAGDEFTRQCTFFVRAGRDERAVMPAVRAAVKQADSAIPINNLTSMQVMIDNSVSTDRLIAALAVAFAILASVLAAVGLYGTISYSVARRTREFGIRLVLGAIPKTLLLFVMREVGWLTAIGIAIGLPVSYALARVVESQLYGIQAHDPVVLAVAAILILGVAFAAALAPALRAMRIQPLQAIRYE